MMRVNLLDERKINLEVKWNEIFIVLIIIFIFILPAVHYYFNYTEYQQLKNRKASIEGQIEAIEPELERYEQLVNKIDEFEQKAEESIEIEQYQLTEAYRVLGEHISSDTALLNLSYTNGEMSLEGEAKDIQSILNYSQRIQEAPSSRELSLESITENEFIRFDILLQLEKVVEDNAG